MAEKHKLMKRGLIVEKRQELEALEIKIDRCVKDLEYYAFPFDGVESIETDKVLQAAQELTGLCDRWKNVSREVSRLESEV